MALTHPPSVVHICSFFLSCCTDHSHIQMNFFILVSSNTKMNFSSLWCEYQSPKNLYVVFSIVVLHIVWHVLLLCWLLLLQCGCFSLISLTYKYSDRFYFWLGAYQLLWGTQEQLKLFNNFEKSWSIVIEIIRQEETNPYSGKQILESDAGCKEKANTIRNIKKAECWNQYYQNFKFHQGTGISAQEIDRIQILTSWNTMEEYEKDDEFKWIDLKKLTKTTNLFGKQSQYQ